MIRVAKLTDDEMVVLTRLAQDKRTLSSMAERITAIMFASNGVQVEVIALSLFKKPRTISSWLNKWNEQRVSSLFTKYIGNKNAAKLTKEQKDQVKLVLQSSPRITGLGAEFWSPTILRKYIKAEFGVIYESRQSYYLLLKYSDLSFKYPDKFDRNRDEMKVKLRVQEIAKEITPILKSPDWELFCADEVRLEQEAEIRRAWLKKGEKTIIKINRKKEHQNYVGFLSQKTFRANVYRVDWQNTEQILKALKRLLVLYPTKRIAIIWDNATWHRSRELKAELGKGGLLERVHLIAMPPYAPDENPIEHVWNTAKKHAANIQYGNFNETRRTFENFVRLRTFKYTFRKVNEEHLQEKAN